MSITELIDVVLKVVENDETLNPLQRFADGRRYIVFDNKLGLKLSIDSFPEFGQHKWRCEIRLEKKLSSSDPHDLIFGYYRNDRRSSPEVYFRSEDYNTHAFTRDDTLRKVTPVGRIEWQQPEAVAADTAFREAFNARQRLEALKLFDRVEQITLIVNYPMFARMIAIIQEMASNQRQAVLEKLPPLIVESLAGDQSDLILPENYLPASAIETLNLVDVVRAHKNNITDYDLDHLDQFYDADGGIENPFRSLSWTMALRHKPDHLTFSLTDSTTRSFLDLAV